MNFFLLGNQISDVGGKLLVDALKASVFSSSHHHHILEPARPPPTVSVNALYSLVTHAQSCRLMTVTLQRPTNALEGNSREVGMAYSWDVT